MLSTGKAHGRCTAVRLAASLLPGAKGGCSWLEEDAEDDVVEEDDEDEDSAFGTALGE